MYFQILAFYNRPVLELKPFYREAMQDNSVNCPLLLMQVGVSHGCDSCCIALSIWAMLVYHSDCFHFLHLTVCAWTFPVNSLGFGVILLRVCLLLLMTLLLLKWKFCVLTAWCLTVTAFPWLTESFSWHISMAVMNKAYKVLACQVPHTIARNHLLPCICFLQHKWNHRESWRSKLYFPLCVCWITS